MSLGTGVFKRLKKSIKYEIKKNWFLDHLNSGLRRKEPAFINGFLYRYLNVINNTYSAGQPHPFAQLVLQHEPSSPQQLPQVLPSQPVNATATITKTNMLNSFFIIITPFSLSSSTLFEKNNQLYNFLFVRNISLRPLFMIDSIA